MSTTLAKPTNVNRRWILVDAEGKVLGRMASRIASILRGKNKVTFTPYIDTGDFVVVINAEKVKVTGNKLQQKTYGNYSGYPSGLKTKTLQELLDKQPEQVIQKAVKGMLPRGPLGRKQLSKLKIYAGANHPHGAQEPKVVTL